MSDPLIGQVIGNCEIVREIGRGGMSVIYQGFQPSIGRQVAVKVLSKALLGDETFMERFNREVHMTAALEHPHIIPINDYGEQDGLPYIVMRYVPGGSLADLITFGALELDTTARITWQVAQALDFAHGHGIIHRDIKPANILLDAQQNAILTDFGVARVMESTQQLTRDAIVGTPSYLAPELVSENNEVTPAVDIYGLGVTVYHMLAGQLPFSGDTAIQVMWAHVHEPAPLISTLRPDLPPGVDAVLQRALAKSPGARYPTAAELAIDLYAITGERVPMIPLSMQVKPGPAKVEAPAPAPDMQTAVQRAISGVVKILRPDGITGTGIYLPNNQVITCEHVVEGANGIYIRFYSGEQIEALPIAIDPRSDLALLALTATPTSLTPEQLSGIRLEPRFPKPGEPLVAIGHPLGLDWSVSGGHFNAVRQPGEDPLPQFGITMAAPLVQVDVTINAGNSGGPIIDAEGALIGMADSIINPAIANNIGFAISAQTVIDFWNAHAEDPTRLSPYTCGHYHMEGESYCPLTGKPVKPEEIIPMPTAQSVRYTCGHRHPPGLTFCPLIGKPVTEIQDMPDEEPVQAKPIAEVRCTNCGNRYAGELSACPQCGKPRRG